MSVTDVAVVMSGDAQSPPVETTATGYALIVVDDDEAVSGMVEAPDIADASAFIEDDATDAATPVVIMLVPVSDGRWQVPSDTRPSPAEMSHYESGKLSANVRSKAHPMGEVRAAGGVRSLAVQIARECGATVIGTASAANRALVESLGVDEFIDYRSQKIEDAVEDVDVVLDTLGGAAQEASWKVLNAGGLFARLAHWVDTGRRPRSGVTDPAAWPPERRPPR